MHNERDRLIQIIPAPAGMKAYFVDDDGTIHGHPVAALGLTEDGIVVPIAADLERDDDAVNLVGTHMGDDKPGEAEIKSTLAHVRARAKAK